MGVCGSQSAISKDSQNLRVDTKNLHVNTKHEAFNSENSHESLSVTFDLLTTSKEYITKVYQIDEVAVGKGYFGEVKKAKLKNNPTKFFAIKTINKELVRKEMNLLAAEVDSLKTVDHPNVVKFYETYQDAEYFHLVLEYCSGSELFKKIADNEFLKETEAKAFMKQIFWAVSHLHKRNICHRDIKPENFLISH